MLTTLIRQNMTRTENGERPFRFRELKMCIYMTNKQKLQIPN